MNGTRTIIISQPSSTDSPVVSKRQISIGRDVIVNQGDWEARLAANK